MRQALMESFMIQTKTDITVNAMPRYAVDGGPSKALNREAFGASHVPQRDITNVPEAVNAPNALLKRLKESLKAETKLARWCI
jgi:di/tripeptidase